VTSLNELDAARVIRALRRFGWEVTRSSGSHQILRKTGHAANLSVPMHKGRPVKQGLMRKLLKVAGIPEADFLAEY
jgi:predicted RNA binding protein YcfA (HicA-like mRNA interferase family)